MTRPLALLLAAAALAFVAAALPSPALMPAAVGLAAVAAGAAGAVTVAARRVRAGRSLPLREARENEPLRMQFTIAGLGRLPVTLDAREASGAWTPLGTGLELAIPRRGAYCIAPSTLRVRDRLGIAEKRVAAGPPERVLILPAPDAGLVRAVAPGPAAGDPDPDGLQAYTPGIPVARVHWPALARGAGLHVRRVAAGPHELPLVVVDTSGRLAPGALDWAARAAAGHVLRLARSGGCRVLLSGDRHETTVEGPAAWLAIHRRLAMLAPGPSTPAPPGAIRIAAAAAAGPAPPPPLPPGVEPVR
jgi:uncharacterized protein (DUF58 family)